MCVCVCVCVCVFASKRASSECGGGVGVGGGGCRYGEVSGQRRMLYAPGRIAATDLFRAIVTTAEPHDSILEGTALGAIDGILAHLLCSASVEHTDTCEVDKRRHDIHLGYERGACAFVNMKFDTRAR